MERPVTPINERLKLWLGGRLPRKLSEAEVIAVNKDDDFLSEAASWSEVSYSSTKNPSTSKVKQRQVDIDQYQQYGVRRAPLLYPPITSPIHRTQGIISAQAATDKAPSCPSAQEIEISTPSGLRYCPFIAVTKFPYKFVNKQFKQPIATAFFDAGKIWERSWDLALLKVDRYYIWTDEYPTTKPIIFILEAQFQSLIDEINSAFPELKWALTSENEETGLVLDFPFSQADLHPRWLGHSTSREKYEELQASIRQPTKSIESIEVKAFQQKLDLAINIARQNSKASRHREEAAMTRAKISTAQLNHAYHYLGFASTKSTTSEGLTEDIILIAIDLEAYERSHKRITEVGIATLDTRDIKALLSSTDGKPWREQIRARHFLISEHQHLVNSEFVRGCPDKFEFGKSEVVSLSDLPKILASCFRPPFSKTNEDTLPGMEERKVVLVGHDIGADIAFCHQIGFSILNRSSLVEVLDTAIMYKSVSKDNNSRSLGSIMMDFGLEAWNLHNAGNDAVYTLWALLAMCMQAEVQAMPAEKRDDDESTLSE